jgi:hypothetical protein
MTNEQAIIINPGSRVTASGKGWTNSLDGARKNAQDWFDNMKAEGFTDLVMTLASEEPDVDGHWRFVFTHTVTGVAVELHMHGVDDIQAHRSERLCYPRVYWDGGSSSVPELKQFAAEGFEPVMTYRKADQ